MREWANGTLERCAGRNRAKAITGAHYRGRQESRAFKGSECLAAKKMDNVKPRQESKSSDR